MFRFAQAAARPSRLPAALTLCALLALQACDTITPDWFGGEEDSAAEPAVTESEAAAGSAETGGTETGGTETGQVVEIISPETAPAYPPPGEGAQEGAAASPDATAPEALAALPPEPAFDDDPQQLIGMGPASLSAFLGAPELIRREAPASLWQYRAGDCVLDVVLYPDRSGDKVTYLEARENGATKIAPRSCLNKLLRAKYDGDSG